MYNFYDCLLFFRHEEHQEYQPPVSVGSYETDAGHFYESLDELVQETKVDVYVERCEEEKEEEQEEGIPDQIWKANQNNKAMNGRN